MKNAEGKRRHLGQKRDRMSSSNDDGEQKPLSQASTNRSAGSCASVAFGLDSDHDELVDEAEAVFLRHNAEVRFGVVRRARSEELSDVLGNSLCGRVI